MPLDATPGGSAADSYLSVAAADSMAASVGLATWATKTTQQKEAALRRAAQDIDAHRVHSPTPWKIGQALLFPRLKDAGLMPVAVQWAALYQADYLATSGESDRKNWEGPKAGPVKDAGTGSPLCPRAFTHFARLVARAGEYAG